jgi:hypothetical protein
LGTLFRARELRKETEELVIGNEEVAQQISDLMIEFGGRLNASVALVRDHGTSEELQVYRQAAGKVMADMLLEIMNPLYAKHPKLKPVGLK